MSDFTPVGAGYRKHRPQTRSGGRRERMRGKPVAALLVFAAVALGCILIPLFMAHDPADFHLGSLNQPPNGEFWFGTDSLGRDIFAIIWHGGRASLFIGLTSAAVITVIGVAYGCLSGMASGPADSALMLVLSLMGRQNPLTISLVIGVTGWFALARIVRGEVRQIRNSEYILASRSMGGSFGWIARRHLIPNVVSAIMFVVVSSIATSMAMESTLSFLGLGLPVDELSWGSMLALADRALLLNSWWVIVIPGVFLVVTLLSITAVGHHLRAANTKAPSQL